MLNTAAIYIFCPEKGQDLAYSGEKFSCSAEPNGNSEGQKRTFKLKKKKRIWIYRSAAACLILFLSNLMPIRAVMIQLSLDDLTTRAEAIVLAEVQDLQCQWSMDKSIIVTVVILGIQEVLKGRITNHTVVLQVPGGIIGGLGLKVSDMPEFVPKERVLVFLQHLALSPEPKNAPLIMLGHFPAFRLFGAAQGKFSVDEEGLVRRTGYLLESGGTVSDRPLTLDDLKREIRKSLRQSSMKGKLRDGKKSP